MVCGGSMQNCFAAFGMASLDFTYLSQSSMYFKNVCSSHCNISPLIINTQKCYTFTWNLASSTFSYAFKSGFLLLMPSSIALVFSMSKNLSNSRQNCSVSSVSCIMPWALSVLKASATDELKTCKGA